MINLKIIKNQKKKKINLISKKIKLKRKRRIKI